MELRPFVAGLAISVLLCHANAADFEVASVKVSKSGNGFHGGCHGIDSKYTPSELASAPPLGRCVITAARLSHLISIAWDLNAMQLIKNAPIWVIQGTDRFNIEAKAEDPAKATEAQLLEMLQALLVDRFELKFHRESTLWSGYALVVSKKGPKLTESKEQQAGLTFGGGGAKPAPGGAVSIKAQRYTIPMLADLLSRTGLGQTVDKTGLAGIYDFTLEWDESAGPSLFSALTDQLGLRLESQKVPVSQFIIDSAQKPTAN